MGFEHCGRRGLAPDVVAHVERLLARDEPLSDDVIARRAGCSKMSVWRIRTGRHPSQQDADRRGAPPARVRLALQLLAGEPRPSISHVARLILMNRRTVSDLANGRHITQRHAWPRAAGDGGRSGFASESIPRRPPHRHRAESFRPRGK